MSKTIGRNVLARFIGALLVGVLAFSPVQAADDFQSVDRMVSFLGYLRRHLPTIYQDFVVRYNAVEFFGTAQEALDRLHLHLGVVRGYRFEMSRLADTGGARGALDLEKLQKVLQTNSGVLKTDQPAADVFWESVGHLARLEGLRTGLFRSASVPNAREIFRLPLDEQVERLTAILKDLSEVQGVEPRRIGIDKSFLSGADVISLFQKAANAQKNIGVVSLLTTYDHLSGNTKRHASESLEEILTAKEAYLVQTMSADAILNSGAGIFKTMPASLISLVPAGKFHSLFKATVTEAIGAITHSASSKLEPILSMRRGHPFELLTRGSVGDCSSFNTPMIPFLPAEEIYWIEKDRDEKGYFQFTRLLSGGEDVLYVNTISGAEVSRQDARVAFAGFLKAVRDGKMDAKRVAIPVPQLIPHIINFPEIATLFRELIARGRPIKLQYRDERERHALAPFTEDYLDLPHTNQWGIEIPLDVLDEFLPARTTVLPFQIATSDLFPTVSRDEAFVIALELRNRETEDEELDQVLTKFKIHAEAFDKVWKALGNPGKKSIREFHVDVQKEIAAAGVKVNWAEFSTLPLLYRGHFQAPDALDSENWVLTKKYLDTYLLSYSDLDYVFRSLAPHYPELAKKEDFRKIVQTLFKKNLKEMDRLLDFYELEQRSAYRTLINLFRSGLSQGPFEKDIETLKREIPLKQKAQTDQRRKDGIFIRTNTLLGAIAGYPNEVFEKLMAHLEDIAPRAQIWEREHDANQKVMPGVGKEEVFLDLDDARNVCEYISAFMMSGKMTSLQIQRFETFVLGSDFGLSFTKHLGLYKVLKLNVAKIMEVLFSKEKFEWAAFFIHKDWWSKHPKAQQWMNRVWQNGGPVGAANFIIGLRGNPGWLKFYLSDYMIDALMMIARYNIIDEKLVIQMVLSKVEHLKPLRLQWLSEVTTVELARMVLNSFTSAWPRRKVDFIVSRLVTRFPEIRDQLAEMETRLAQKSTSPNNKACSWVVNQAQTKTGVAQ